MNQRLRSGQWRLGIQIVIGTLLLAACGSAAGPSGAATGPVSAGSSGPAVQVTTSQDPALGGYLAGQNGRTLYVLTTDTPGVSSCSGACATTWPPFTVGAGNSVTGGTGVTGTFATITRADGTQQVTFAGASLYYYSGDSAPGNVNGQGTGGVWFIASPTGGPNTGPGASPTSGASSGPGASPSAAGGLNY